MDTGGAPVPRDATSLNSKARQGRKPSLRYTFWSQLNRPGWLCGFSCGHGSQAITFLALDTSVLGEGPSPTLTLLGLRLTVSTKRIPAAGITLPDWVLSVGVTVCLQNEARPLDPTCTPGAKAPLLPDRTVPRGMIY